MSTAGHFLTMLGVLAFYFMILDSHIEKKITQYLSTLVPRFNKRVLYYVGKLINFNYYETAYKIVPNRAVQNLLTSIN
jgi:hypothetical protein